MDGVLIDSEELHAHAKLTAFRQADDRDLYSGMIRLHKHQSGFEAISCRSQKSNFSASCISLGSRALEITAKFDAPKIRPGRVKFG
jgi:beta-phosphoglucomutase-like phosphatase (HAD superfamily)